MTILPRSVFVILSSFVFAACALTSPDHTNSADTRSSSASNRSANASSGLPSIDRTTSGLEKMDGFFPLYWNESHGRLLLEIPASRLGEEFLYLNSMGTGGGMNGPRLDRSQIGNEYIARFQQVGPKVHFVLANSGYVSTDPDQPALAKSVKESFPESTVGSFEIMAEQNGSLLIDVTSYFLQDVFNVRRIFGNRNLGNFRVESSRSYIYMPLTNSFPKNTEIEAALTYTSDNPAWRIRQHAPDGRSVTMRQHHSLVQLPDDKFRPRDYDPRGGYLNISFFDFSKGFDEDLITRYAVRHRLEKKDPDAEISEPVEPIVYYLDPAVPEPYRTAFHEGMAWFNGVYEAAGFRNAFELRDMPDDMNPMDARYNVVMWVHRSEAGASIGPTFRDPRTGEIIKAAVRMDSHRSLVNFNQFAGMIPSLDGMDTIDTEATLEWMATLDPEIDAEEFTMARRRQHAAHELGHTLGLAHNFAAESFGRGSVMDYPAAHIRLRDGKLDLSQAYSPGPGAFDTLSIRWGYTQFNPDEEKAGLDAIIQDGLARGLFHISAPHTGSFGSHPNVHAWSLSEDPISELQEAMDVRRFLMENFDERAIREGEPLSLLRERFVPVYVHHRFILSSTIKYIGGMEFRYALRGDGQTPTSLIPGDLQREALRAVLDALQPEELAVPERVLALMAPSPWGYNHDDRAFSTPATPAVDQLEFARALTNRAFSEILESRRTARVVAFSDRNSDLPTLEEILITIQNEVFRDVDGHDDYPALRRVTQRMFVEALMEAASDRRTVPEARAACEWMLDRIEKQLYHIIKGEEEGLPRPDSGRGSGIDSYAGDVRHSAIAQNRLMQKDIRRFLDQGTFEPTVRSAPSMPNMFPLGQ